MLLRGRLVPMSEVMDSGLSPEYIAALRSLRCAQKQRVASGMYWTARKVKAARLRQLHPDWSEDQVARKVREVFTHAVT
jgi:hypothetical protein